MVRVPIGRHPDFGVIGPRTALRQLKPASRTRICRTPICTGASRRAGACAPHGDEPPQRRPAPAAIPMRLVNNVLWRLASAGIAISELVRQFCIRVEGVKPEKSTLSTTGLRMPQVDRREARANRGAEFEAEPGRGDGSACRLIAQKGLVYSLRAFARLDAPNAVMVIAGDGNLRGSLQAEARALGVADRVHFLGWREDTASRLPPLTFSAAAACGKALGWCRWK